MTPINIARRMTGGYDAKRLVCCCALDVARVSRELDLDLDRNFRRTD